MDSIGGSDSVHFLVFFDEGNESCPLNFYRLTRPVVKSDDEVEKVGLPKVRRRLLLKVSSAQPWSYPEMRRANNYDFFKMRVEVTTAFS